MRTKAQGSVHRRNQIYPEIYTEKQKHNQGSECLRVGIVYCVWMQECARALNQTMKIEFATSMKLFQRNKAALLDIYW